MVRGDKAERVSVQLGMSNFDFVEIKDMVKPGDVLIISDMSAFKHAKTITLTK